MDARGSYSLLTLLSLVLLSIGCTTENGISFTEETIQVSLSPGDIFPPVAAGPTGSGTLTIDQATGELSGTVTLIGTEGEVGAVNIEEGFAGITGPVVVSMNPDPDNLGSWIIPEGTVLTQEQLTAFNQGRYYIIARSDLHPGGELRGQIMPVGVTTAQVPLNGAGLMPPVVTDRTAIGFATVDQGTGFFFATVHTPEFPDVTGVSLFAGATGIGGEMIHPLSEGSAPNTWETALTLQPAELDGLLAGEFAFNVATLLHPTGEVGGPIELP